MIFGRWAAPQSATSRVRSMLATPWVFAGHSVVFALSARLCYLFARSLGDETRATRPQIESAALLLVIAGLLFRAARTSGVPQDPGPLASLPTALWPVMSCLAVALYWPALSIGLLADDFILVQHAATWQIGPVALQLFRPLPLAVWAILLKLGGGAVALHILNILLHGTNAYLTMCVVRAWVPGRWWAAAAGLVVLTLPLGPEAVAWCSGVFDVLATTLILTAVLIARRYDARIGIGNRILLIGLSIAALLSKETAAVGPFLIAIDAWVGRSLPRRLMHDLVGIGGVAAVFGIVRLVSHFGLTAPPITKYRLQRVAFDSFGSLAAPWHLDLFRSVPFMAALGVLLLILLLTIFFVISGPLAPTRNLVAGALWIVVSLMPVFPTFYVSPELQGSRYLYLGSMGWAAILVVAAAEISTRRFGLAAFARSVIVLTIAFAAYGTRIHLRPWTQASALREVVLNAAAGDERMHSCEVISVQDLPQSRAGAYVFPNGAREAFADIHLNVYTRNESGSCSFRWNGHNSRFEAVAR